MEHEGSGREQMIRTWFVCARQFPRTSGLWTREGGTEEATTQRCGTACNSPAWVDRMGFRFYCPARKCRYKPSCGMLAEIERAEKDEESHAYARISCQGMGDYDMRVGAGAMSSMHAACRVCRVKGP